MLWFYHRAPYQQPCKSNQKETNFICSYSVGVQKCVKLRVAAANVCLFLCCFCSTCEVIEYSICLCHLCNFLLHRSFTYCVDHLSSLWMIQTTRYVVSVMKTSSNHQNTCITACNCSWDTFHHDSARCSVAITNTACVIHFTAVQNSVAANARWIGPVANT